MSEIRTITMSKISDDSYNIQFVSDSVAKIEDERVNVIRFMDDCIDAILRLANKMTSASAGDLKQVFLEIGSKKEMPCT